MKKRLIVISMLGIFVLLVFSTLPGMGIINNTFIVNYDDFITYNPENPTGNHGWYVDPVDVTFHARDPPYDSSGLYCIKYRVLTEGGDQDPDWETYYIEYYTTDYDFTIRLEDDGVHIAEFYAIDGFLGNRPINEGPVHSSIHVKIDMSSPVCEIDNPEEGYLYFYGRQLLPISSGRTIIIGDITIDASAIDLISGVFRVHFMVDEIESDDTESPYTYTFQKFYLVPTNCELIVSCYDFAGNKANDISMSFTKWL